MGAQHVVGSVGVEVVPTFAGFAEKLRAGLGTQMKGAMGGSAVAAGGVHGLGTGSTSRAGGLGGSPALERAEKTLAAAMIEHAAELRRATQRMRSANGAGGGAGAGGPGGGGGGGAGGRGGGGGGGSGGRR